MSLKGIRFHINHPKSEYSRTYYIREPGVICPICESNEFDLMISKTRDQETRERGHHVEFGCDGCGHTIGLYFSMGGIKLTEVIRMAKRDYSKWKCNLNRKGSKCKQRYSL